MAASLNELSASFQHLDSRIEDWQERHEQADDRRFGDMGDLVNGMTAKLNQILNERERQVGAAQAIAELAERRASRNTRIVSIVSVICALATLCIQKHWLGL